MADNDQRCLARRKFSFEPLDREQIKVVGRLVKQQNIGQARACGEARRRWRTTPFGPITTASPLIANPLVLE